jgi:hypothetical protein
MSETDIRAVVNSLTDVAHVLVDANPDDKAEIFRPLGLKLTHHPRERLVRAAMGPGPRWQINSVRGASAPESQYGSPLLTSEFALDADSGAR